MVVVAIVGLLASLAIPALLGAATRTRNTAFVADLRVISEAFEMYNVRSHAYPPDGAAGVLPPEVKPYLKDTDWSKPTPIGGLWDWDFGVNEITAGVSVRGPLRSAGEMEAIDRMIDDGHVDTGTFRRMSGRYTYILEP